MKKYEPLQELNPQKWLDVDEYERINLVHRCRSYQNKNLPDDAKEIYYLVDGNVEKQLVMQKMSLHRGLPQNYTFLKKSPFSKYR